MKNIVSDLKITDLDEEQINQIELSLEEYDFNHITNNLKGDINVGIIIDNELVAGVVSCITTFKILYISTVFVAEKFRGMGIGTKLMRYVEMKAVSFGVNLIRLDTFNWQGVEFYKKLGYTQVGYYENRIDGFSEHFFIKQL